MVLPVFNSINIKHCLNRIQFGFRESDFARAQALGNWKSLIDEILKTDTLPTAPNAWVNTEPNATQQNDGSAGRWYLEMSYWWQNLMLKESLRLTERMTLFFHNHFACERDKVNYPQHMYKQNQLFRRFALGNFKQLVKEVSKDPAMLIYLDGNNSRGNGPNENYARELFELFTLGIGNYTETDIKQAAKALSGWQVSALNANFVSSRWYTEANLSIFGKTEKFTLDSLIDWVFEQPACAQFICRKLYKEFIFYKPNEAFVTQMANLFKKSNFELKPLMEFILTSDEFYRSDVIGSKIKSPQDLIIGTYKALGFQNLDNANAYELARILQMQLFQPPNVAGWPGQRDWISSTTYSHRQGFTDSLLTGRRYNGVAVTSKLNPIDYIRTSPNAEKAVEWVDEKCFLFLASPLPETRKKFLLETLLDGTIVANWSTYLPGAEARINKFLRALMRLPNYQLH